MTRKFLLTRRKQVKKIIAKTRKIRAKNNNKKKARKFFLKTRKRGTKKRPCCRQRCGFLAFVPSHPQRLGDELSHVAEGFGGGLYLEQWLLLGRRLALRRQYPRDHGGVHESFFHQGQRDLACAHTRTRDRTTSTIKAPTRIRTRTRTRTRTKNTNKEQEHGQEQE